MSLDKQDKALTIVAKLKVGDVATVQQLQFQTSSPLAKALCTSIFVWPLLICVFSFYSINLSIPLFAQNTFQHKSAAVIEAMTPEQRVIEYCTDYVSHGPHLPSEYTKVLDKALFNDGIKVFPSLIKIFDEFEPNTMKFGVDKSYRYYEGAIFILGNMDSLAFRVRNIEGGADVISALQKAIERMRTVRNNKNKYLAEKVGVRLRISENILSGLVGQNLSDECVMYTLKKRYNISLTATEQYEFINYLAAQIPYYPSKGERVYRKKEQECEYVNADLFHEAYLAYKATKK